MKINRKILFGLLAVVALIGLVSALTRSEVFFDGFESNNLAVNWTASATYTIVTTPTIYAGTYSVLANGGTANALLTITTGKNVTNQTSCNLSAVMQIHTNFDGGEYLCLDYSNDNGATWNLNTGSDGAIGGLCQDGNVDTENVWRNVSYSFAGSTATDLFKFRFRQNSNNANEDGYMDNLNLSCSYNTPPTIVNLTASNSTFKGGNTITIYANTSDHLVNDTEADSLTLYCDSTTTPTAVNTDCTGGTTSDSTYPYVLTCTFATSVIENNYTEYCRVYDGTSYSSVVPNVSYAIDSTPPTTTVTSVAGDTTASYYDIVNDGRTDILTSGEANMACRWSSSDVVYTSMTNDCIVTGIEANCSVNDVAVQNFTTRYVSCQDVWGNSQNSSQNLDVQFYLDYSAPTTTDNSVASVQAPNYTVTITEVDNVDADPTSYYCTSSTAGCNPVTSIDNGGTITYTASNRGANYLRYYSVDDANNTQVIVNKTININHLPNFTSATDNAVTIKGGKSVNVSSVSNDSDSGQEMKLFVCSSLGATSAGCTGTTYCSENSSANVSCIFTSESDSALHSWYAYIYDELNEAATNNPQSGSYTTDLTSPIVTLVNPINATTITQNSVTITIAVSEALTNAWYSLNLGVTNVSMSNSSIYLYSHSNSSIANGGYNLSIWANDSVGNEASLLGNIFTIDAGAGDTTAPVITIWSPANNSYSILAGVLFNITSDEVLKWAGYILDLGSLTTLGNVSATNWNSTETLAEGNHNVTFYANDSSANQGTKASTFYVDLTNPAVNSVSCTDVNDSKDVTCSINMSDIIGLSYVIVGYNATGSWINSSQITLSGLSYNLSYLIGAGNTTPGVFGVGVYLYDLSGRNNLTSSDLITIADDEFPTIHNITYAPNTTNGLDPFVRVEVNATIVEDYKINKVELMWQNSSDGNWISVLMQNNSAIANGSSATVVYNASFVPITGTYYFKINATDLAGNMNVSSAITINVANESSFWNGTSISNIKSVTYAQRSGNNSLGFLYINNTGDDSLDFNVSVTSSALAGRFDINYTLDDNATYTLASDGNVTLTILVNSSGISSGLYPYNLTVVSVAGTQVFEKYLNIQTSAEAYLQISIDTYSSSVITSQTGVTYVVSVTNLGTQDASNVYLNWTLPSIFSLASGNLSRSFSTIPIGGSGTNTITIDVASSTSDATYYINASATASNADAVNTSKAITVSNPVTITTTTTTAGGGGGGGGAVTPAVYAKTIEIVRGKQDSFEIEVENKNYNSILEDLTISMTGFLSKYITITPSKIGKIFPRESKSFKVTLKIPSYIEGYEEYILKAVVSGTLVSGTERKAYSETQNIKLIVQEISNKETSLALTEAEEAVLTMVELGFNVDEVNILLEQARNKLSENKNKESETLSQQIIDIMNKAIGTDKLIRVVAAALEDPGKSYMLVGNVAKEFEDSGIDSFVPLENLLTGKATFESSSTRELLELAIAAFLRGDYNSAEERANSARTTLLLERKGNIGLFIYMYWQFVLIGLAVFLVGGFVSYKGYQKSYVSRRINDIDKEEDNIKELMVSSQKAYYSGKMSSGEFDRIVKQHHEKLASIRQERLKLRSKRIKILGLERGLKDLESERNKVENEIKKVQTEFYNEKKITKEEYGTEFKILNERLAEIEGERITSEVSSAHKVHANKMNGDKEMKEKNNELDEVVVEEISKVERKEARLGKNDVQKGNESKKGKNEWTKELIDKGLNLVGGVIGKVKGINFGFGQSHKSGKFMIDHKVVEMLKEKTSGKDVNGKWIKLNVEDIK